jgi:hypothetical protein
MPKLCHRGMEHDELELSTEIRSTSARQVRLQEEKLCAKDLLFIVLYVLQSDL